MSVTRLCTHAETERIYAHTYKKQQCPQLTLLYSRKFSCSRTFSTRYLVCRRERDCMGIGNASVRNTYTLYTYILQCEDSAWDSLPVHLLGGVFICMYVCLCVCVSVWLWLAVVCKLIAALLDNDPPTCDFISLLITHPHQHTHQHTHTHTHTHAHTHTRTHRHAHTHSTHSLVEYHCRPQREACSAAATEAAEEEALEPEGNLLLYN